MKRYAVRPRADYWDEPNASDYLAKTVLETERKPYDSGLLDQHGNKLFAQEQITPVGFLRFSNETGV